MTMIPICSKPGQMAKKIAIPMNYEIFKEKGLFLFMLLYVIIY